MATQHIHWASLVGYMCATTCLTGFSSSPYTCVCVYTITSQALAWAYNYAHTAKCEHTHTRYTHSYISLSRTHAPTHPRTHVYSILHTHTHTQLKQTLYHVYVVDTSVEKDWENWQPKSKKAKSSEIDTSPMSLIIQGQRFPCVNGHCWVDMSVLIQECFNLVSYFLHF